MGTLIKEGVLLEECRTTSMTKTQPLHYYGEEDEDLAAAGVVKNKKSKEISFVDMLALKRLIDTAQRNIKWRIVEKVDIVVQLIGKDLLQKNASEAASMIVKSKDLIEPLYYKKWNQFSDKEKESILVKQIHEFRKGDIGVIKKRQADSPFIHEESAEQMIQKIYDLLDSKANSFPLFEVGDTPVVTYFATKAKWILGYFIELVVQDGYTFYRIGKQLIFCTFHKLFYVFFSYTDVRI